MWGLGFDPGHSKEHVHPTYCKYCFDLSSGILFLLFSPLCFGVVFVVEAFFFCRPQICSQSGFTVSPYECEWVWVSVFFSLFPTLLSFPPWLSSSFSALLFLLLLDPGSKFRGPHDARIELRALDMQDMVYYLIQITGPTPISFLLVF